MIDDSDFVSCGEFGERPTFPSLIQERIDAGHRCGSSIGVGWLPLIIELDENISKLDPDYIIHQIKEKFGLLRFYIGTNSDSDTKNQIYDLIEKAENKSATICEICGKPGTLGNPTGRWIKTRCEEHMK